LRFFSFSPTPRRIFTGVKSFRILDGFGMMGIQLSFVLSGYLITRVLLETKNAENYYKSFFMRRFLRIGPLYYIQILAVIADSSSTPSAPPPSTTRSCAAVRFGKPPCAS